ncbi:uncharacterized protein N7487_001002 [Penicillium crustosum]|uniref:uncharacterized protein n=1 Tax=Penicillium crustosum TaxID=36656 RepID=UPI00239FFAC2|nr:uncharacterized protein N7487_001002 [Penicillium crustosum]KAJ5417452.1 hypothetical protein N7487_001002 [Penicillium crustosum]
MPYEYDQESVLANGIYPVANAIEMDALLLLFGILLLSLSLPELDREIEVPHSRIQNPESRYGRQSSIIMAQDIRQNRCAALL